jgi:hypothetical protein
MRRVCVLALLLAAGCGGAEQGADEPSGTFKVEVVGASFPRVQHIAQSVVLRLRVRNADSRALPVAVTVETEPPKPGLAPVAFGENSYDTQESDTSRPVWVLAKGPSDGETAYVNTWTAGSLRPGQTRTLSWRLVAAKAGSYVVRYRVSPGLTGKAKAASGVRAGGLMRVRILSTPVAATVGAGGQVVRGG